VQAQGYCADFGAVFVRKLGNCFRRKRILDVFDFAADVAPKMRVRRSGRFVKRAVGAGELNFGDHAEIAQTRESAINSRLADSRLPPFCKRINIRDGQVPSGALLADDILNQAVVLG
jgi:hypothetical protein